MPHCDCCRQMSNTQGDFQKSNNRSFQTTHSMQGFIQTMGDSPPPPPPNFFLPWLNFLWGKKIDVQYKLDIYNLELDYCTASFF